MQKYISAEFVKKQANLYYGSVHDAVLFTKFIDSMPAADVEPVSRSCGSCPPNGGGMYGENHSKYIAADFAKEQVESFFGNGHDAARLAKLFIDIMPAENVKPVAHA